MIRDFAAIVPVFDPEPGLESLCAGLVRAFDTVVVVDDGSVRDCQVFGELPFGVTLLRHDANRGKGAAMKTALAWLMAHCANLVGAVFADGDGQHRLEDIVAVASACATSGRVVFGERTLLKRGVPFFSRLGNLWAALEVRFLYGYPLKDTQTGLRAIPARLFREMSDLPGNRFEYEAGWFAHLKRLREPIREVPIETVYVESNRSSHFRPLADTFLTQRVLLARLGGRKRAVESYLDSGILTQRSRGAEKL